MMKRILLTGLIAGMALGADAGEAQKVIASTLERITFDNDKVVLHYNDGTQDKAFNFDDVIISFNNESTDIEAQLDRKTDKENKKVYNLNGQYVGNSTARLSKGIYLIDGKKVVIK